jgi:hypothetical protein
MVVDRKMEAWAFIEEFPMYMISDEGHVYSRRWDREIPTSQNQHGHMKVSLSDYDRGERHDRSVARLVAKAFLTPPNSLCDHVAILNGDTTDVRASNLAWRPRWFVWKYSRQLKEEQPVRYYNIHVRNVTSQIGYINIFTAGIQEGLLFEDIWESTFRGSETFPYGQIFEIG